MNAFRGRHGGALRHRTRTTAMLSVLALSAGLAVSAPAHASALITLGGRAAAVEVQLAGTTAISDLTAASSVSTTSTGVTHTNSLASASVEGIVTTGALNTSVATSAISGGDEVVSTAETARLNVLNGLITADAITTTSDAKTVDGVGSGTGGTQALNLRVAGFAVPDPIPANYSLTVPGVASIQFGITSVRPDGAKVAVASVGISVVLLSGQGSLPSGAALYINPTSANIGVADDPGTGHYVQARSYGTSITADAGPTTVRSDPTAPISLSPAGTAGVAKHRSIAAVNLAPALTTGVVYDTVSGINTPTTFEAKAKSQIANVSLFGGVVKVDAVTARAEAAGTSTTPITVNGTSNLLNLTINGTAYPASVAPNTVITLPFATITLNKQVAGRASMNVRAIDVVVTTASYGLPVGAEIIVASAWAKVA